MMIPLEITYRNLEPVPSITQAVRKRAANLEKFADTIVGCRVTVESPHRHNRQGNRYHVRVELSLPGGLALSTRSPDEHAAHEEVQIAIRDAFRAVKRQLRDLIQQRRGQVKGRRASLRSRVPSEMPIAAS